ncbi:MAG: hypothetical protein ACE5HE_05245 [Phycisphaerae bacterium]
MPILRHSKGTTASLAVVAATMLFAAETAAAGDETQTLARAVELFEDGEYLTAQEMLTGLDRSKLTTAEQARRDEYVNRCQIAITMDEKALRDLEDAETALAEREFTRAENLLHKVLKNEYASATLRKAAEAHLRDLKERAGASRAPAGGDAPARAEVIRAVTTEKPSTQAEEGAQHTPVSPHDVADAAALNDQRARALTAQADEMTKAGKYAAAEALYRQALGAVPGYPEAVEGLQRVQGHYANMSGPPGGPLAERIRRRDEINWRRSVARYRDIERMIRDHAAAGRFEDANNLLIRGRQIIEAGRQFADPVTKYENLHSELEALSRHIREQERRYHERKVAETRREIEEQRSKRLRQVEENRARQVDLLMQQALRDRKDGDLDAAVEVLKQVIVIDPKHSPARWLMDILEDQRQYRKARETRQQFYDQTRKALEDVELSKIPWHQLESKYPDDWLEIISRDERALPGQSKQDELIYGALDRPVPVDFNREPFEKVIERLAATHRLNLIVNWADLKRAGVDRNVPIELTLPQEISLKKAITEVLNQAGGGTVEMGFEVSDGVITVATQELLDHKAYPAVYDITDLLMEISAFNDPPMIDLRETTRTRPRPADRADRPWVFGDDDDNEPEEDPEQSKRIRKIIDLIESTVAPESWRDQGGSIGAIKEINGQLVITQNSSGHKKINGLLAKLREERAIQVSVEALFLTVSSHYLEELGMDLDIALNMGNAGYDFIDSGSGARTDPVLGHRLLLPRTFTQLGFTQATPAGGVATPQAGIVQPFGNVSLVPEPTGGSGSNLTPIPLSNSILDFTDPATMPSDVPGSFAGSNVGPALSIFGSFLDNIQVDFLIRATQADSRTSVLTAPRLVVFNGGSAWVAVTVQTNFVSGLNPIVAQGAVAQAPQTQTIDAGASLFVRATVTADRRYVMMLLAPGVTRLLSLNSFTFSGGTGAFPAFIQLPTLSAQRLQTVVSVPDGGTLLIGGQKLSSETEVEAGVPILSKIPILKRAYSARTLVKDEQTLLILIKPKILIQSEQEELAFPTFKAG